MKEMLENTSYTMLREYFYEFRGCYPPEEFDKKQLIEIILRSFNR